MKNITLLLIALFSFTTSFAQESSWKVSYNKKVIYTGNSDKEAGTATVSAATVLKGKSPLTITYTMEKPDNSWNRTFYINNANDQTLHECELKSQTGTITIPFKVLQQLAKKEEAPPIYGMAIPKDPN